MSDDVNSLIGEEAKLAQRKSNFSTWWDDLCRRVLPESAQFTTTSAEGEKRTERLFSTKPVTANQQFAAVMEDLLTPSSQMWHALKVNDDDFDDRETKEYLERLNKLLFMQRYRPGANFASQKRQGYLHLGAIGNSCLFTDEELGLGPRYLQIHMREVSWAMNHQGQIDTLYRRYKLAQRDCMRLKEKSGWDLPEKITTEKDAFKEFEFIHCVRPNDGYSASAQDYRGMQWASYYLAVDAKQIVSRGGFHAWPYAIGRYTLAPGESYGRGPSMACWPAILTLNEEKKTILRAGQKEVDPPLLLTEDGALDPFNVRPGALNHGMVTQDGQPLALPLKTGSNIPLGLELMQLEAQDIDDANLTSIYKILQDPRMTAFQVQEIIQQKAVLLAPTMGRQHSEDLGNLINREISILARDSRYPWIMQEMPDELRARGGNYDIEYRSAMARALRSSDSLAIMRTFEALPAAMQVDPDAAMVVDVPSAVHDFADINGMPAKHLRDIKDVRKMIAQKRQQEQQMQVAAASPELSQAALNAAKAEQLRAGG